MDDKNLTTPAQNPGAAPAAQDPAKSLDDLLSSLEKEAAQLSGNTAKSSVSLPASPTSANTNQSASSSIPPVTAKPSTPTPPVVQTSTTPATAYVMTNKSPSSSPSSIATAHTAGAGFNAALEKTTPAKKSIAENPASLSVAAIKTGTAPTTANMSAGNVGGTGKSDKKTLGVGAKIAGLVGMFVLVVGLGVGILVLRQSQDLRQQAVSSCSIVNAGTPDMGCWCADGGWQFHCGDGQTIPTQPEIDACVATCNALNSGTGGGDNTPAPTTPGCPAYPNPNTSGCDSCGGDDQGQCGVGTDWTTCNCNAGNTPCDPGLGPVGGSCQPPTNTPPPGGTGAYCGGGRTLANCVAGGVNYWCGSSGSFPGSPYPDGFCGLNEAGQIVETCNTQILACVGYVTTFGSCAAGSYNATTNSCMVYCTNLEYKDGDDCGVDRPCKYVWDGRPDNEGDGKLIEIDGNGDGDYSDPTDLNLAQARGDWCPNGNGYSDFGWDGTCFTTPPTGAVIQEYWCPNQSNLTTGCQSNANASYLTDTPRCFEPDLTCGVQQIDIDINPGGDGICHQNQDANGNNDSGEVRPCHSSRNILRSCGPTPVPTVPPTTPPAATPTPTPTPVTCGNACTGSGQGNCSTGLTCDPTAHVCKIPSCVGQGCTCSTLVSPPTCTGLAMTNVGDNIYNLDATAQQGTAGLQKVDFFYRHVVAPITATSCGTSQGTAEYRWVLISTDTTPADGWTATWNASALPTGEYQVAANVFDTAGQWCTGNPGCEGGAGQACSCAAGSFSCPACMNSVTINPPPLVCTGISSNDTPAFGQPINFLCGLTDGATRYEFRYMVTSVLTNIILRTWTTIAPDPSTPNESVSITPNLSGRYTVQCRPCQDTLCLDWQGTGSTDR